MRHQTSCVLDSLDLPPGQCFESRPFRIDNPILSQDLDASNQPLSSHRNTTTSPAGMVQVSTPTSISSSRKRWLPFFSWITHFIVSVIVLSYPAFLSQGDRKYIPVNAKTLQGDCTTAFVDVFASSMDEPDAFVCCGNSHGTFYPPTTNTSLLCTPPPSFLFFAQRLSKFPDAWVLPLFPLLVRGALHFYRAFHRRTSSVWTISENIHARRRLYLYLALIQVRGWILYLTLDELEDSLAPDAGSNCWYEGMLHANYQPCQGRSSDFSDHVVLYFAQILPIALTEVVHSFVWPFWDVTDGRETTTTPVLRSRTFLRQNHVVPTVLVLWLINLYLVTMLGAYKTSAYFHTYQEIVIGFLISLTVQIPLCLMQCTGAFPKTREYFFGLL